MKILSTFGLLLLLPAAIQAVEIFPVYAGVGYGLARYVGDEVKDPLLIAGQKAEGDRGYYEAYLGIDLGDVFSVELAYAQFNSIEETYETSTDIVSIISPNNREHIDFDRYSLMLVAEYPLTLGISIYATGGYAYYDFDRYFFGGFSSSEGEIIQKVKNGDHGLEYGFGAKWEVLSRIFIRGQWSQSLINDRKVQSNRLSVEIHF